MNKKILTGLAVALSTPGLVTAEVHTVTDPIFGPIGYFDDWGFPQSNGRTAFEFDPINGFGPVSLIQQEVTQSPDGATQDPPHNVFGDFLDASGNPVLNPFFPNANMDSSVNLFLFGYTDPSGSTFDNHQVDQDGDHLIPRADMTFGTYDMFLYRDATGTNPDQDFDTFINFDPFPMSDARGWCAFQTHPLSSGEPMAGQVQFDYGFAVTLPDSDLVPPGTPAGTFLQLIPNFQMRSYGTLVLDFTLPTPGGPVPIHYVANAAPNNTDPSLGRDASNPAGFPSPDFYNHVSFMGGGVIPLGAWLNSASDSPATKHSSLHPDQSGFPQTSPNPQDPTNAGYVRGDGAIWHINAFGGFPFMLRADALRNIEFLDNDYYGALDHDIDELLVSKHGKVGKPIKIQLKVENNHTVAGGTTLATVKGNQGGVVIFAKSMIVPAIIASNGNTMVYFGSFTPTAGGDITWTASITDADSDDDTKVETTQVK